MLIKELMKQDFVDYTFVSTYQTNYYYEVTTNYEIDTFQITFVKKKFKQINTKQFESKLFEPYLEQPKAFGIFDEDILAGVIEMNHEEWNKRIRITELFVLDEYRRQGYGHKLMHIVKDYLNQTDYRAIVLETQSCNDPAISFYLKEGFTLIGHDLICYTNDDVASKEVRLEFGLEKKIKNK
jgi:ribosomal protein S18 acetylase RimI-like enzyme